MADYQVGGASELAGLAGLATGDTERCPDTTIAPGRFPIRLFEVGVGTMLSPHE